VKQGLLAVTLACLGCAGSAPAPLAPVAIPPPVPPLASTAPVPLETREVTSPTFTPTAHFIVSSPGMGPDENAVVIASLPADVRARWSAWAQADAVYRMVSPRQPQEYAWQQQLQCEGRSRPDVPCDPGPTYEEILTRESSTSAALMAALTSRLRAPGASTEVRLAYWLLRSASVAGVDAGKARAQLDAAAASKKMTSAVWAARLWRAEALLAERKTDEARAALDALVTAPPTEPGWLAAIGLHYERDFDDHAAAERTYALAMASGDVNHHAEAGMLLVAAFYDEGRFADAIDAARPLLEGSRWAGSFVPEMAAAAADRLGGLTVLPLASYSPGAFARVASALADGAMSFFRVGVAEDAARAAIAKAPGGADAQTATQVLAKAEALRARSSSAPDVAIEDREDESRRRVAGLVERCLAPRKATRDLPGDGVRVDLRVRVFAAGPAVVEATATPPDAAAEEMRCLREVGPGFFEAAPVSVHTTVVIGWSE